MVRILPGGAVTLITYFRRPSKLARGHHAAMPYEDVAGFID